MKTSVTIAFQGEPGAFSEEVALAAAPDARTAGYETFDSAAHSLISGDADLACLPVENSLFGSIGRTYELIHQFDLRIVEARIRHIRQCLVARATTNVEDVRTVASHPVALEQCRSLFQEWPRMRPMSFHDTAGAVRAMMDGSLAADACIAGEFAATRYGARVLLRDIHDETANYTRFFLLTRVDSQVDISSAEPTDSTICCELANRPGSLRDALSMFADADMNLTNLVCRPIPSRPWSYRFFFEVATKKEAAFRAAGALAVVGNAHVCGCYVTHHSMQIEQHR
jgi:prephenate dehydratase